MSSPAGEGMWRGRHLRLPGKRDAQLCPRPGPGVQPLLDLPVEYSDESDHSETSRGSRQLTQRRLHKTVLF